MATIKDVAARAGVSIKTVSRVINHDPAVRDSTRQRVGQAISELHYVPDFVARSLRRGRTATIGIVTDFIATTPHSVEIIAGVQDMCSELGLTVLIANTKGRRDLEKRAITSLVERKVDGIVYATVRHLWLKKLPSLAGTPTVLVNCSLEHSSPPALVPDDFQGGYSATKYLIDRGHRDIGLITLIPTFEAAELRGNAYRQALLDHGLPYRPELVRIGQVRDGSYERYTTLEATQSLFDGAIRPSAIVCGKDEIAMRVYNIVRAMGLGIPEDVSIVGYDNFVNVADNLDPPLTTVALPYYRMGREAAELLRRLLSGDEIAPQQRKIPCPLIERQSCRDWTATAVPTL